MSRRGGKKSFSPQFERDYSFYLAQKDIINFAGSDIKKDYNIQFPGESEPLELDDDGELKPVPFSIPYSSSGKSAKVCFHQLDSEGKCKPCLEPKLLVEILTCKAAVNLQIKTWAQGRAEYTLSHVELQEYMEYHQAPDWVFKAVEKQKEKILKEWATEEKYKSDFYAMAFQFHIGEKDVILDWK